MVKGPLHDNKWMIAVANNMTVHADDNIECQERMLAFNLVWDLAEFVVAKQDRGKGPDLDEIVGLARYIRSLEREKKIAAGVPEWHLKYLDNLEKVCFCGFE